MNRALYALMALATAILLLLLARYHLHVITIAIPLDVFEGTMPLVTGLLAQGGNPYSPEHQPLYTDAYPPLYNLLAAPFTLWFGNSFLVHRTLSGVFIWLSCLLLYRLLRVRQVPLVLVAGGIALLYAALLFYSTPLASPNSAGLFFFLCALLLPELSGYSIRSLLVSAACGILAFYCKQYFALSLAFMTLYLCLFVSLRRGLYYSLGAGLALAASLLAMQYAGAHFIDNTVLALGSIVYAIDNSGSVFGQLLEFGRIYLGLFLFALGLLCLSRGAAYKLAGYRAPGRLRDSGAEGAAEGAAKGAAQQDRRLLPVTIEPCLFYLVCSSLVIVFVLGRNPGNYMTYLFQLMTPFALVVCLQLAVPVGSRSLWLSPLLLWSYYSAYTLLPVDMSYPREPWQRLQQLISENQRIFNSSVLVMPLLEQDRAVYHGGLTSMFPFAARPSQSLLVSDEHSRLIGEHWLDYVQRINGMIASREFQLIVLKPGEYRYVLGRPDVPQALPTLADPRLIRQHYRKQETLSLSLTQRHGGGEQKLQVWVPRVLPGVTDLRN